MHSLGAHDHRQQQQQQHTATSMGGTTQKVFVLCYYALYIFFTIWHAEDAWHTFLQTLKLTTDLLQTLKLTMELDLLIT